MKKSALIIVDVQNDFITGSLALLKCKAHQDGAEVVQSINQLLNKKRQKFDLIVYTMDYHPPDHISFSRWPVHCVANTWGAKLHCELMLLNNNNDGDQQNQQNVLIIKKGTDKHIDSYSAFWDNEHRSETELNTKLKQENIENVFICGLALDFCVYYTAMDSAKEGYNTYIIKDCCRSMNGDDSQETIEQRRNLKQFGIKLIITSEV